jgi:hypothetical protein
VDQTYNEAAIVAVALNFAIAFRTLVAEGMTREEALAVILAWVRAAMAPKAEA